MNEIYDLAIIGAGPAGLTAALYGSRNLLKTVLFEEKAPGGQLLNTELVDDYPGCKSILGPELAMVMVEQATEFGTEFIYEKVVSITVEPDNTKLIQTETNSYKALAVIITTGGNPRKLDVVGELELAGRGVSYCAVCDGAFFKERHLAVIGGGDAAIEEALYLTRYASKVTIIHRRKEFKAQPILLAEARNHDKIEFVLDTVVEKVNGENSINSLTLKNVLTNLSYDFPVEGLFIFIGFIPNSTLVNGHLDHDEAGYYLVNMWDMSTNIEGVYIAGDVRAQLTRQITTAVGDATIAAMAANKWVEEYKKRH